MENGALGTEDEDEIVGSSSEVEDEEQTKKDLEFEKSDEEYESRKKIRRWWSV